MNNYHKAFALCLAVLLIINIFHSGLFIGLCETFVTTVTFVFFVVVLGFIMGRFQK